MILWKCVAAFLLVFELGINGVAQSQATQGKSAESPLAPVAWFVGGAWVSDVKDPSDGSVVHVENHITWLPTTRPSSL